MRLLGGRVTLIYIATVTQPTEILTMDNEATRFGFTGFAETWNGRLAMIGFLVGLATELLTGQGILSQIGLI